MGDDAIAIAASPHRGVRARGSPGRVVGSRVGEGCVLALRDGATWPSPPLPPLRGTVAPRARSADRATMRTPIVSCSGMTATCGGGQPGIATFALATASSAARRAYTPFVIDCKTAQPLSSLSGYSVRVRGSMRRAERSPTTNPLLPRPTASLGTPRDACGGDEAAPWTNGRANR